MESLWSWVHQLKQTRNTTIMSSINLDLWFRGNIPTRQIANFMLESESDQHILTGFCRFTASSKDDWFLLKRLAYVHMGMAIVAPNRTGVEGRLRNHSAASGSWQGVATSKLHSEVRNRVRIKRELQQARCTLRWENRVRIIQPQLDQGDDS